MKKLLLSATACLTMAVSVNAQEIQPCGTYKAREIYLKKLPGYAAKIKAAEATSAAEYQAYLQNLASSKTSTLSANYTFTIPVVFHVLHLGEDVGTGINVSDAALNSALAQVNEDFARKGADTATIDPLYEPLYVNSRIKFELAKKDPMGKCTNGIVRHYDEKTNWSQADLFNYQYSTMAVGNWNPSKYLNIYVVKNIIDDGGAIGQVVGYTYLPGTSPIDPADAIVYHYAFLGGLNARAMSHEIGHWLGLSHTFGGSNSPGFECGNDDIADTPPTTGFFGSCPKPATFLVAPTVTTPVDSSDVVKVTFGAPSNPVGLLTCTTSLNSLTANVIKPVFSLVATTVVPKADTVVYIANGTPGAYSDFSGLYGNDFNSGTTNTLTVRSMAKYTDNNFIGVYFDKNRNGSFTDLGENILVSSASLFGPQTFTTTVSLSAGMYGIYRMRIITANTPVTGPTMTPSSGEIEDYNFNIGTTPSPTTGINLTMASCSDKRPNVENIMDYSGCPKMFTQGQTSKMRTSAQSMVSYRQLLVDTINLVRTGLLTYTVNTSVSPNDTVYFATGVTPCAPIADFAANNFASCAGQAIVFNSTTYNTSVPTTFSWVFEGGTPSTSTLSVETVTYSTPGTYSVSLTVTNADGTSTKSVANYVKTNWNAGPTTLPYTEGFESGQYWPAGFVIENPNLNSPGWVLSPYGNSSAYSLVLNNANQVSNFPGYDGNVDILNLPPFDFTNTTNISISFDYSFARKTGVVADTFKLQYSKDCGGSWITIPGLTAATMATSGGTVNAPYIPWSSATPNPKWVTKAYPSALLGALNNKRDIRLRMWFQNDISDGESQNLYIDNINISGTVGLNEFENSLGLSIYPNPTSATAVVEFTSPSSSKVNITVFDVTGRVVEQSTLNGEAGITNKHTVNSSNRLISGIYFISINIDGRKLVKKLIIE